MVWSLGMKMEIDGGKGDENGETGGRGRGNGKRIGGGRRRGTENRAEVWGEELKINGRGGGEAEREGRGRKREGDAETGSEGRKREGGERPGQLSEVSLTSSSSRSRQPGSPFSQLRHILLSPPPQ
jgi:hypothetical protein